MSLELQMVFMLATPHHEWTNPQNSEKVKESPLKQKRVSQRFLLLTHSNIAVAVLHDMKCYLIHQLLG